MAETNKKECIVNRFDHIEVACKDLGHMKGLFERLGFQTTQVREAPDLKEHLMVQGKTRMLLVEGAKGTFAYDYVSAHGEGVSAIAYNVPDAASTLKTAVERGAELAVDYKVEEDKSSGLKVSKASIRSFGDVRATFVERSLSPFDVNAAFEPGFQKIAEVSENPNDCGFLVIDHLTNNVEQGKMDVWKEFYERVYGWIETRYFDIRASKTGLLSKVMQSPDGAVKIPINEPTEEKSQIQEFINEHKGAGVQHIAMTTNDIVKTVAALKERGFEFLKVPHTYYEAIPGRNLNIKEDLKVLEKYGILVDGDDKGYLLQIFTQNQIGPLFFEVICRRGHNGFGEGNFKALFEAIERDQERRGVL